MGHTTCSNLKPNGDIRICGDYKITINKYLSDFKYPLPLIDEIFASLQGGQMFSKLDLSSAYNQLILDDKSQLLCMYMVNPHWCFKDETFIFWN